MFSQLILGRKTLASPRSVMIPVVHDALPPPPPECACKEEMRKLQQENRQLRQELMDANYRIRELEELRTTALIIPDSSRDEDSDDFSVEAVETSVTSSTRTLQTGSILANEKRKEQQQQDEKQERREKKNKQYLSHQGRHYWNMPVVRTPSHERTIADLKALFRSDSSLSTVSSCPSGNISDITMTSKNNMQGKNHKVSTYTSRYFLRSKSTDSESSATDNELLGEI